MLELSCQLARRQQSQRIVLQQYITLLQRVWWLVCGCITFRSDNCPSTAIEFYMTRPDDSESLLFFQENTSIRTHLPCFCRLKMKSISVKGKIILLNIKKCISPETTKQYSVFGLQMKADWKSVLKH